MKNKGEKKMLQRILPVFLAVLIFVVCATGCGGSDKPDVSDGTGTGPNVDTDTSTDVNWNGDTSTIVDSDVNPDNSDVVVSGGTTNKTSTGGKTTTKKGSTSGGKLFSSPITFELMTYEHPSQSVKGDSVKFKAITEATNVTLKVNATPQATYTTKVTTALASGVIPDITYVTQTLVGRYASSGVFMNLTPHLNKELADYYRFMKGDESWERTKINGKVYGFSTVSAGNYVPGSDPKKRNENNFNIGCDAPVIRYDILEKHNLALPTTWDEWFDVMKTLKTLYPESAPYCGRGGNFGYINKLAKAMSGYIPDLHYNEELKQYTYGVLHDEFREVVEFLRSCWEEGIIDNTWSNNASSWNDKVVSGRSFFWYDNVSFAVTQNEQLQKTNPDAKLMTMPLMANDDGKRIGQPYTSNWYTQIYSLSAKSTKKDALLKFMNWCYSDEGYYVTNYGQEGVTYTVKSDGTVSIPDALLKRYAKSSSPFYEYDGDMGTGMLSFTPLAIGSYDNKPLVNGLVKVGALEMSYLNEQNKILEADFKKGYYPEAKIDVSVDASVAAKTNTRKDAIYALNKKYILGFIDGKISMTEWDSYIAQVKKLGAQQVLDAYNAALKKAK